MEILEKINQQLDEFKAKRESLVKELRTEFPALLTPLLSQSKKIESIGWTQYTPYFNDGDECVFSAHVDDLEINGEDEYDDSVSFLRQYTGYGKDKTVNPEADQNEIALLKDIKGVLRGVPEDFFKDLFGDHAKITVYKDGKIEVDEYEHD